MITGEGVVLEADVVAGIWEMKLGPAGRLSRIHEGRGELWQKKGR